MTSFFSVIVALLVTTLIAIVVTVIRRGGPVDKRLLVVSVGLVLAGAVVGACDRLGVPGSTTDASVRSANPVLPSPAPSDPALTTYIEDLRYASTTEPYDTRESANINGVRYSHSQGAEFCSGDDDRVWDYDLGRDYSRFRATIGLDDSSTALALVRYEIVGDGQPLFSRDIRFGTSEPVDVPVQGVLRLRLVTTLLSEEGACGQAIAQWGEVRLERNK